MAGLVVNVDLVHSTPNQTIGVVGEQCLRERGNIQENRAISKMGNIGTKNQKDNLDAN